MSYSKPQQLVRPDPERTQVDLTSPRGGKASVSGPAMTVVAIVAVIGLVVVAVKVTDVAQRAIDHVGGRPPAGAVGEPSSTQEATTDRP